jgi:O-antigen ligase
MTGSRAGYVALVGVGILFGVLRYRWVLVLLPVAVAIALVAFPNVADRLTFGFGAIDVSGNEIENWDAISGGRTTDLWPPTVDEIVRAPVGGHGRLAIWRTSLRQRIEQLTGGCPNHPHNAYLEMLLDSGAVGLIITILLFVGFPVLAYRRRRQGDPLLTTVLHAGLAAAATILIMGISGQTFWPREGVDAILCLYALMMAGSAIGPPIAPAEPLRYAALALHAAPGARRARVPARQLKAGRGPP